MLPPDDHVHSEWSWDTGVGASMEASCARAVEIGLPSIAFTEHVDFTDWGEGDGDAGGPALSIHRRAHVAPLDVEGYAACLARCRDRFPGLRIVSGIEAGEPHRFAGSVAAVLRSGSFERVLGSLHSVVDGGRLVGAAELYAELPPQEVVRRYLAELLDLVTGSDVFAVLAHPDFARRYWPQGTPYDEALFEEEYRAVFRALAGSGRALELNTASPLAAVDRLRWWREEGGRAVSFGSDAHQPWRVGARFTEAVAIAQAAGFRPGRDPFDIWRR